MLLNFSQNLHKKLTILTHIIRSFTMTINSQSHITDSFDLSGLINDYEATAVEGSQFRYNNTGTYVHMPGIGRTGAAEAKGHHTYRR